MRKIVPLESFKTTEDKINSYFRSGYDSILTFKRPVSSNRCSQISLPTRIIPCLVQLVIKPFAKGHLGGFEAGRARHDVAALSIEAVPAAGDIQATWDLITQLPLGETVPSQRERLSQSQMDILLYHDVIRKTIQYFTHESWLPDRYCVLTVGTTSE